MPTDNHDNYSPERRDSQRDPDRRGLEKGHHSDRRGRDSGRESDRRVDHDRRGDYEDRSRRHGEAGLPPPPPGRGSVRHSSAYDNRPHDHRVRDRTDKQDYRYERAAKEGSTSARDTPPKRNDQPTVSGATPPARSKGTTPGPSNSLFSELLKHGKNLLAGSKPAPEDDGPEAGEITADVSDTEARKRKHSPITWNLPPKAAKTQPNNILDRVVEDMALFKQLQEEMEDIDPDAPAAMKSSPSVSGDDDNEMEARYKQLREEALKKALDEENGMSEDNEDDDEAGYGGKSGVASRWLDGVDNDKEGAQVSEMAADGGLLPSSSSGQRGDDSGDEHGEPLITPRTLLNSTYNMLQECRSVDEFEKLNRISEGTYGVVYRAREKATGRLVALKRIKMEKELDGFPVTSIREINVLLNFHHPNIVNVSEIVMSMRNHDHIFMVMELMDHDLKSLMDDKRTMSRPFSIAEVKCLMQQLLAGVAYLHDQWVLHRDLKTSNILYNSKGELKICDFGLARQYGSPLRPYTHTVVTLWYRSPELLLGQDLYSTAVDVWSVGCIMGELLLGRPMFQGSGELDQVNKICDLLGTPTEEVWPGYKKLRNSGFLPKPSPSKLRATFQAGYGGGAILTEAGFDLLSGLLAYDPEARLSAGDALRHRWFTEAPLPQKRELMPMFNPRKENRG